MTAAPRRAGPHGALALLACLLTLPSCGFMPGGGGTEDPAAGPPAWIATGSDARFPERRFLVGVGTANGTDASAFPRSDDAARAEMFKVVRVRIESETRSVMEERTALFGEHQSVVSTQGFSEDTVSRVSAFLEGSRIPDRYVDARTGRVYSLAVLDRAEAAALLDARIADARSRAAQAVADGRARLAEGAAWEALEKMVEARSLLAEANGLAIDRAVLAGAPAESGLRDTLVALERETGESLRTIRFGVRCWAESDGAPGDPSAVQDALTRVLGGRGLRLADAAGSLGNLAYTQARETPIASLRERTGLDVLLLCRVGAREQSQSLVGGRRVHFYRASADLVLLDLTRGTILYTSALEGSDETKSGRLEPVEAARESTAKASGIVAARFGEHLAGLFGE